MSAPESMYIMAGNHSPEGPLISIGAIGRVISPRSSDFARPYGNSINYKHKDVSGRDISQNRTTTREMFLRNLPHFLRTVAGGDDSLSDYGNVFSTVLMTYFLRVSEIKAEFAHC